MLDGIEDLNTWLAHRDEHAYMRAAYETDAEFRLRIESGGPKFLPSNFYSRRRPIDQPDYIPKYL